MASMLENMNHKTDKSVTRLLEHRGTKSSREEGEEKEVAAGRSTFMGRIFVDSIH